MKVFRVVYDNNSSFVLKNFEEIDTTGLIIESFSLNKRKEIKTARGIQEELGTKKVPLVQVLDENLELIDAIWSENNPDWEKEILKKILIYK